MNLNFTIPHFVRLLVLFLSAAFCCPVGGNNVNLKHITLREGLSGLSVTNVNVAGSGRVWIATSNGVCLYNGYTTVRYGFPNGWPNNFCYQTASAPDGTIYAATPSGLLRLLPYHDNFEAFAKDITSAECLLVHGGKLYVGNRLGLFEVDNGGRSRKLNTGAGLNANNSVRCIRSGPGGKLWFTTRNEINSLDVRTGKVAKRKLFTESGLNRFDFADGKIFVGTKNNGLFVMPIKGGEAKHLPNLGNVVSNVRAAFGGRLVCIATDGNGAFTIDAATLKTAEHYGYDEEGSRNLPSNAVYDYVKDSRGIGWFGMFRHGLSHQLYSHPLFKTYSLGGFTTGGIDVSSFCDTPRYMVVAKKNGFYLVDKQSGRTEYIDTKQLNVNLIKNVGYMDGCFYIGSYDSGLIKFQPSTMQLGRINGVPKLAYCTVNGITTDRKGQIWLATSEGLFRIGHDGSVRNYNDNNSKLFMGLRNIVFDRNGNGWIGTANGVCLYLADADIIKNSEFPQGFFNKLSLNFARPSDFIYCFNNSDVYYTDPSMRRFGRLDIPDGIIEEICTDFAKDKYGTYWIVSEKGLFAYSKQKGVRHFGSDVGMTEGMVNPYTLQIDHNGTLWLATDDGLKYVNTRQAASFSYQGSPQVGIGEIVVDGIPMSPGLALKANDKHEISIGWNFLSQRLTLRMILTDFSCSDNSIIEYSTDGGKEWTRTGMEGTLAISGLMPGRHKLMVRQAGAPSTTAQYIISVRPTAVAWLELFFFLAAIALCVWWYKQRKNTMELLDEHKETVQALIDENRRMAKSNEEKYQKVRVANKELSKIARQMEEYVKEKKPYLNNDLKMSDIATAIGVSPSMLSQVFTLHLKQNYYDYINTFRLSEFKRRISLGDHKRLTIKAISEECGFKKTSFFSTFRKMEGITPTEYIKKAKK